MRKGMTITASAFGSRGARILAAGVLALVATISGPAWSTGHGHHGRHGAARRCLCCPRCGEVCKPSVERDLEDKTCWEVECETICIPRVRFPWEKAPCGCCPPAKCARAKKVNVLIEYEYKCPVCKYSFEAPESRPCGPGCRHCQGGGPCTQAPAAAPAAPPVLPPAPTVEARAPTPPLPAPAYLPAVPSVEPGVRR